MAELPGEPYVGEAPPLGEVIAAFVHVTDVHVTDAQSPARFEFVNREALDPRFRELLPMQRPQEMLNTHAVAAMVRTINRLEAGPVTGSPLQLVVTTGDAIDNTQRNELTNFLALMEGAVVRPDSGAHGYEGVQRVDWPSEIFWKPDGPVPGDVFQRDFGFPRCPGLLDEAVQPFPSEGLRLPWLRGYGNHEQVCQGVGVVTPALAEAMAGSRKPIEMPLGLDPDHAAETFASHPEAFMSGASLEISSDPDRRPISRGELMPKPCYAHDIGEARFLMLDTVCDAGGADGTIDPTQLGWLEQMLEESRDRFVVVLSHHGYDRLSNPRAESRAAELLRLLQRFTSVGLWLNGHTHANRITARRSLWEVTTGSLVDWPCQARVVEIFRTRQGRTAIACTMLDHDGYGLAGLHRELAANVPGAGFGSSRAGTSGDRNAVLRLRQSVVLRRARL